MRSGLRLLAVAVIPLGRAFMDWVTVKMKNTRMTDDENNTSHQHFQCTQLENFFDLLFHSPGIHLLSCLLVFCPPCLCVALTMWALIITSLVPNFVRSPSLRLAWNIDLRRSSYITHQITQRLASLDWKYSRLEEAYRKNIFGRTEERFLGGAMYLRVLWKHANVFTDALRT